MRNLRRSLQILVLGTLLLACGTRRAERPTLAACGPTIAGFAAIAEVHNLIIMGEVHGSQEVPALVGRLACEAALRRPVVLAVELDTASKPDIDATLTQPTLATLLKGREWNQPIQDGRTSRAMAGLILQMQALRAAGRDISVEPFAAVAKSSDSTSAEQWEQILVASLQDIVNAHPGALVLVLSGDVHARTGIGVPWNPAFQPMGHLLATTSPAFSILLCGRGQVWGISADVENLEAPTSMGAIAVEGCKPNLRYRTLIASQRHEAGFDAVVNVGELTVSPPAAQSALAR